MTDYEYYMCKANDCNSAAGLYACDENWAIFAAYSDAADYYIQTANAVVGTEDFLYYQKQAKAAESRALA